MGQSRESQGLGRAAEAEEVGAMEGLGAGQQQVWCFFWWRREAGVGVGVGGDSRTAR